ncbi:MAG: rod shape-determining protein MreC [Kyrpidia sp.]|nr:rod shape-determining protein MreC [Kyrpidia sp.]
MYDKVVRRRMAAAGALMVAAGLFAATAGERRAVTWPERVIGDTVAAVQGWLYRPAGAVAQFFGNLKDLQNVYEENAVLKASLHNYFALQAQVNDLETENERLRKIAGLMQSPRGKTLIPANVVDRQPDLWHDIITIDVGTAEGVQKDMAVVTADNALVGRVTEVRDHSAVVQLLTDTSRQTVGISALILGVGPTPPSGIISKVSPDQRTVQMTSIGMDYTIKPGLIVETSGFGGLFPKGLIVGTVSSVARGEDGLTQTAIVTPLANLDNLQEVFVVRRNGG